MSTHLAGRIVFFIPDVDTFSSVIFDKLLKTLEMGRVDFILTVVDLTKVRLAVQSRSVAIRLRPLTFQQAREQLAMRLDVLEIEWEEKVLDLLAAYTAGLPGAITRIVDWFPHLTSHGLEFVRSALGWGWIHDAANYWRDMLEGRGSATIAGIDHATGERNVSVKQLQAFLYHIRMVTQSNIMRHRAVEPALLHYDTEQTYSIASLLAQRAVDTGNTPEQLWLELAKLWVTVDTTDVYTLYQAECDTRCIIKGIRRGELASTPAG